MMNSFAERYNATLERLESENAKLREQLADERAEVEWTHDFLALMAERIRGDADAHNLVDYVRKLEAENAKLRELVRTFYHCTTSGECDECPINGGGPVHLMPDTICDTIHDRMRELGVDE